MYRVIPNDILISIFRWCSYEDLIRFRRINHQIKNLINGEPFWKLKFMWDYPTKFKNNNQKNYKYVYFLNFDASDPDRMGRNSYPDVESSLTRSIQNGDWYRYRYFLSLMRIPIRERCEEVVRGGNIKIFKDLTQNNKFSKDYYQICLSWSLRLRKLDFILHILEIIESNNCRVATDEQWQAASFGNVEIFRRVSAACVRPKYLESIRKGYKYPNLVKYILKTQTFSPSEIEKITKIVAKNECLHCCLDDIFKLGGTIEDAIDGAIEGLHLDLIKKLITLLGFENNRIKLDKIIRSLGQINFKSKDLNQKVINIINYFRTIDPMVISVLEEIDLPADIMENYLLELTLYGRVKVGIQANRIDLIKEGITQGYSINKIFRLCNNLEIIKILSEDLNQKDRESILLDSIRNSSSLNKIKIIMGKTYLDPDTYRKYHRWLRRHRYPKLVNYLRAHFEDPEYQSEDDLENSEESDKESSEESSEED